MKKLRTLLLLFCSLSIFAGCAHYSLVSGGQSVTVHNSLQVLPHISWNMSKNNNGEIWTVDGPALDRLIFFTGIENGKPLFQTDINDDQKMPAFSPSMTALELMDLVEATLARLDFYDIVMENLKPALFDNQDGFCFDFSCVAKEGLRYKGFVRGTVKDNKLYLILYQASALHYHDLYRKEAEKIADSVKFL